MIFIKLDDKQQRVVNAEEKSIFLLAGAGSGKTRVLIERVRQLLSKNEENTSVLILSFTVKSVMELKNRLSKVLDNVYISTFHGLCYQVVSRVNKPKLLDESYKTDLTLSDEEITQVQADKRLLNYKNMRTKPFIEYHNFLLKNGLIDYIDLELLALDYLKNNQNQFVDFLQFDYIFVDEFQDTSITQFELLKVLKSNKSSIFAVGDPDQSIYKFRGTSSKVIDEYQKYFNAKTYILDYNYRSCEVITTHANRLINNNHKRLKKTLIPKRTDMGTLSIHGYQSSDLESDFVITQVLDFINRGIKLKEIAVLYRNHYQAVTLKQKLEDTYLMDLTVLTFHQSKGLEFEVVFVIGVRDSKVSSRKELEEERRLFFVAMTRAKTHLMISYIKNQNKPRFVRELKHRNET